MISSDPDTIDASLELKVTELSSLSSGEIMAGVNFCIELHGLSTCFCIFELVWKVILHRQM